jgi:hypothetical protein
MAEVSIMPAAMPIVEALFADLRQYEDSPTPFLIVHWFTGASENRRGQDGTAVWEQLEPPEWRADVGGWTNEKAQAVRKQAIAVEGVLVLLDSHAERTEGRLIVDASLGKLVVSHHKSPGQSASVPSEA